MRHLAILLLALLSLPAAADEIRMLGTGASKAIVEAMARQFEARTGHRIALTTDTAGGATRLHGPRRPARGGRPRPGHAPLPGTRGRRAAARP